jgi:anaerobic selenocysteine-containing dehydrogenase
MSFFRSSRTPPRLSESGFQPELRVIDYVATRKGDPERGPQVRLSDADARFRMLVDGEVAWVRGERGQQLAQVVVDDSFPQHTCGLRDIPGVLAAESVRVVKPDLDSPKRTTA